MVKQAAIDLLNALANEPPSTGDRKFWTRLILLLHDQCGGMIMKMPAFLTVVALTLSGCTTTPQVKSTADLVDKDTRSLCRIALGDTDQQYRDAAAKLAVRRGATLEKCNKLIAADNAIMTGIAVAGVAAAAGAAAHNGYGGGYYAPSYGVAWDKFYDQYGRTMWRCRDKGSGRFVPDYYCSGHLKSDFTWPGPHL